MKQGRRRGFLLRNKKDASGRGPSAARLLRQVWAARVRAPGSSPSHLGTPKARIMSISWKPWASLGAPSPADAHDVRACGAHHEVTVAGGSGIIEFAGAAPRRPKTCPNATRNACAFRSHSPANFEFSPCRRPRRGAHHEHQRDPRDATEEGRRRWQASLKGFAFRASPSSATAAPTEGARCAARFMAAASAVDPQENKLRCQQPGVCSSTVGNTAR